MGLSSGGGIVNDGIEFNSKGGQTSIGQQVPANDAIQEIQRLLQGMRRQIILVFSQDGTQVERMEVIGQPSGTGDADVVSITPFFVTLRRDPDNPSQLQAFVDSGRILKSLKPTDELTVSNIETWIDIDADDQIWIEITITSYVATASEIKSGSGFEQSNDPWTDEAYVEAIDNTDFDSPQSILRVLVANTIPGDTVTVEQRLKSDLLMSFFVVGIIGRPALIATPSPY